jgi:hypothetical protein
MVKDLFVFDRLRLDDRDIELLAPNFDGWRSKLSPSAARSVRLRDHAYKIESLMDRT